MAEYIERELAEKEIFIKRDQERQHWMEYLDQRKGTKEYSSAEKSVDNWLRGYEEAVENILAIFDKLSADVEPVKRGEWKYIKSGEGVFDYYFKCSECHANTPNKAYPTNPDFCPHCGSKNVSLDCGICCVNYKDGKEVQE